MSYEPMVDEALRQARLDFESAQANHAIEGLHLDPEGEAFYTLLLEERVPLVLWERLAADFLEIRLGLGASSSNA